MMKNTKKIVLLLCSLLFTMSIVMGCSSGPKIGADEAAMTLYNLYIKGDKTNINQFQLSEEDAAEIITTMKDASKATLSTNLQNSGLKVSDEQITQIVDARMDALKKLNATVELVSETKEATEIKLSTTYFDEVALDTKAANDAIAALTTLNITDETEALTKATELYISNLITAYKAIEPSTELKTSNFKFIKEGKFWVAEDMNKFGETIGKLTSGQL